jgi:hypothetical protein
LTPRNKNLAVAAGAATLLGMIAVNTLMTPAATPRPVDEAILAPDPGPHVSASPPGPLASPSIEAVETPSPALPAADPERRSYAIGLHDLQGLPPDAAAGTRFELWVTWEPPLTDEPRLDRLIGDVVLERVVPGTVPEAPATALLSVPAARTGDLIYADTFGRLSVVLPG